jgi:energy-coupling factor transporter ATP-binding protein EcfA2
MATLHNLKIKNFRGIQTFDQNFGKGLTCIIGRGDSGKSTILDAIALVLSSSWTINFYDSDFFNCQTDNPIEIEATLINIPDKLLDKYGVFVRGIKTDGEIIDDMESDDAIDAKPALTIKLAITKELEPVWTVANNRGQEPANISAADRAKLNVSSISDYTDKHFSLNKGNPLYTLFKQLNEENSDDDNGIMLDILREAKTRIDNSIAEKFDTAIEKVIEIASQLGISSAGMAAAIDHRDISIKENKVCLHELDIPLRLKGKGSKRLVSLAIQLSIANPNGIILIDEIEQGLEPDRVQHLVNILKNYTEFQIFFTTHSRNVVVELPCSNLFIMTMGKGKLLNVPTNLQGCVRSNPEALFARKIIVCEGATEIGICRALNEYRKTLDKTSMACLGISLVDGGGANMVERIKAFHSLGFSTCLFCDSDVIEINQAKANLQNIGIQIVDCQDGFSIEQQLFADIQWNSIISIVDYHIHVDANIDRRSAFNSVYSNKQPLPIYNADWYKNESDELRKLLGDTSKAKDWYKRIDHGEFIGKIILDDLDNMDDKKRIKQMFKELSNWIDS